MFLSIFAISILASCENLSLMEEEEALDNGSLGEITTDEGTVYHVDAIPSPYETWNGHVVAAVMDEKGSLLNNSSTQEAFLLLISKSDWGNMTSALNTSTPSDAEFIASEYEEDELDHWRIPTEGEGRMLYHLYNVYESNTATETRLAKALSSIQADPIVEEEKGKKVRYLCENAEKTYSFTVNSVLKAGKTVKTYHLRLVQIVKVSIK